MNSPIVIPDEPTIRVVCAGIAEYQGTRTMLEAEGIIPANTKWPEGYDDLWWDDGKYRYWMVRQRPDGAKGPRKLFVSIDWWCLRQQLIDGNHVTFELERKKRELAEYAYRNSAKGQYEWQRSFDSYAEACADEKFQAFKALIPGLIKPKRARRPKNVNQTQGAAA
ncbi:hypothetical protein HUX88_28980 [Duganella sp. BJB1802]|uniref:hypothetical protein n=1 Tax=Duganella sp. BJB1802 TaxID=2744575 RepID=UPI00159420BE|nr:hypothetical protein [Duganella sp. BJB1802]NVD74523.1 hypothetical protein [Duganella sp. BJB1802]